MVLELGLEADAEIGSEAAALELWSWITERLEFVAAILHRSDRKTPIIMIHETYTYDYVVLKILKYLKLVGRGR